MPEYAPILHHRRRAAVLILLPALLLSGCGGYFSSEWPNLAEGFEDAAARDAALAPPGESAEETPHADARRGAATPETITPETGTQETAPAADPEAVAGLAAQLAEIAGRLDAGRQAYKAAKAAFLNNETPGARGRWLTAQLKLTAVSRIGDDLGSLVRKLRPVAAGCEADSREEVCNLGRRAEARLTALDGYLAAERQWLKSYDPATPS